MHYIMPSGLVKLVNNNRNLIQEILRFSLIFNSAFFWFRFFVVAVANESANYSTWRRKQESVLAVMMILIKVKMCFLSNCSNH